MFERSTSLLVVLNHVMTLPYKGEAQPALADHALSRVKNSALQLLNTMHEADAGDGVVIRKLSQQLHLTLTLL